MYTVVAFLNAAGRAGTVALQNVAGLADASTFVQGNNVRVPDTCNKILAVFAETQATAGSVTNAIRLSSPKMGERTLLDLDRWVANGAIVAANQIPGNNPPFNDYSQFPIQLASGEALQCLTSVDVAAVAEAPVVIVFLTDGNYVMPPAGSQIEHVVFDGQAAAVINTWSPTALVPRQALQAGTYAVVGMKAVSTTITAARLVFPGSGAQGFRPGCIGCATNQNTVDPARGLFRNANLGILGTFTQDNPPQAEILCSVADAAAVQHITLDIVKVA
jgi:hypothetical protein